MNPIIEIIIVTVASVLVLVALGMKIEQIRTKNKLMINFTREWRRIVKVLGKRYGKI